MTTLALHSNAERDDLAEWLRSHAADGDVPQGMDDAAQWLSELNGPMRADVPLRHVPALQWVIEDWSEVLASHGDDLHTQLSDTAPLYTVAIYLVGLRYGGAEEGGWWYEAGNRVTEALAGINPNDILTEFRGDGSEKEALSYRDTLQLSLDAYVNKGRRPLSSVLSDGLYRARVSAGQPPEIFPEQRPQYE